jgi:hypothetical protein
MVNIMKTLKFKKKHIYTRKIGGGAGGKGRRRGGGGEREGDSAVQNKSVLMRKVEKLGTKITEDVIDAVADYAGVDLSEEEKKEFEDVTLTMAPNMEKAALDAVGVVPVVGEAVEMARLVGDLAQSGEKLIQKRDEIENIAKIVSNSGHLQDKLRMHHDFQKQVLDRVDKSKKKFNEAAARTSDKLTEHVQKKLQ